MRKEIPKIAAIFLITVVAVVWGLNFIFFGQAPKSKADEVITLSFDPSSATAGINTDFTVNIKATPVSATNIQLYKININFDKSKVKIKDNGITYVVGQPSSALGADDNSKISAINGDSGQATIKLYGEITNPATGLIMNGATELARVIFTSKTDNVYSVTNSSSSVSKVNADYTIVTVPLSSATFNVNRGVGGTTATPTSTATPVPGGSCPWSAPISLTTLPGSGSIQTHSDFIFSNGTKLEQSIWRGDQGFWRIVPVVAGEIVWASAGVWSQPISVSTLPGSGSIQTHSDFIFSNGTKLEQSIWRGDQGFWRIIPMVNGEPQWSCANSLPTATPIPPAPTATPIPIATSIPCPKKAQGDANCDGTVNLLDYFYYVTVASGGRVPSSVNPDFNGNGTVNAEDRAIIIRTLRP